MISPRIRTSFVLLAPILLLAVLLSGTTARGDEAPTVTVSVSGLTEPLRANVLASLSLVRQGDDPRLNDVLVERLFARAEKEIKEALQPFGYYSPVVNARLDRRDNGWQADFAVVPGRPVLITLLDVSLSGAGRDDPALLKALRDFPLHAGQVLDHRQYEAGKRKLTSAALSAGYRDVSFSRHSLEINPERYNARVFLVLETGPRYVFGPTTFTADFLHQNFLKRLLPYREGEPFSPGAVVELRQSLLNMDYFSEVEVQVEEPLPESVKIPVAVTLRPKNPNRYGFGLGYGTDTGMRGSVEWTNRLLNRRGHQFTLHWQPSERKSSFGGVYTVPVRDPRKDRLTLLAKWEREDFATTETEQRTVTLSFDHVRENGEYSLFLSLLDQDYDTGLDSGRGTFLTPGIKTTWRLADDRLRTSRGIRLTVDLTGADQNILADATFLQAVVAGKAILAFSEKWRVLGRFQLGGTLVDEILDLPPLLRLYAGGDQSVRGYAYKSIAPEDARGNVLGGRYLTTFSIELERELFADWSGAVFYDSGAAYDSFSDLTMKQGAGVGVRWNAPFGQVRLDLANALSKGGNSWRIHFSVGADL
ncbi:MAG: autotransporter assembly complex protein TamA [Desulfobulbaceae bacterium]